MYLSDTTVELYRIFDAMNTKFFEGKLEEPIITIQKTRKGTRGWFEVEPLWVKNGDQEIAKYEINISSRIFRIDSDEDVYELVGTLLHEMCHYSNSAIKHIKDCSGAIHNKRFAQEAERVGLVVEHSKKNGYGITSPSEKLIEYIKNELKPNRSALVYYHAEKEKPEGASTKEKPTKYTYTCPKCGKSFTLKKQHNIKCGDCDEPFEVTEE